MSDKNVVSLSNKVISEITAKLLKDDNVAKFLYYTDKKYETQSILNEPRVSQSKIIDKNVFIDRRIPVSLMQVGAYMAIRFYDYGGGSVGKNIKNMLIDIDIIVHDDCIKTYHGTRDTFLIDSIQNALKCNLPSLLGKPKLYRTYDILGLNVKYNGFTLRFKVNAFNKK